MDLEKDIGKFVQEKIFNEWKMISLKCRDLNFIIQNGLNIIKKEDFKEWLKRTKKFEEDYIILKKETFKIINEHLKKEK